MRKKVKVMLSLTPEAVELLDNARGALGLSRSAMNELCIRHFGPDPEYRASLARLRDQISVSEPDLLDEEE